MATKGPSNHFGNSRGANKGHRTKHISYPWAKDFNKHTLNHHFDEHAKEMGYSDINSYRAAAIHFANYIDRENCNSFIDNQNSTHKLNRVTNEYAIINKKGYVITYYKLNNSKIRYESERKMKKRKK